MEKKFGVATKAIIKNKEGKYLVLYKSETEEINPNEIDIPGGRMKFGENPEESLKREVEEEIGIMIEIIKPSRVWGLIKGDLHLVGITFLAKYISGEFRLSGEHTKYGWADKEIGDSAEVKHIFRIASLSKLITAVAVMKLSEEGKIALEDMPFAKGGVLDIPQFTQIRDSRVRSITVEQLLRHQGGFSSRAGDPMFNLGVISRRLSLGRAAETDEIISFCLNQRLAFTPGHGTRYSNLGYVILSRLIEAVSGVTYEEYVKEYIFKPAGVYDIHLANNFYDQRFPNEVKYYEPLDEEPVESYLGDGRFLQRCYGGNNIRALLGAGAWVASPSELLKLIAAIDGRGNVPDILSEESIRVMTTTDRSSLPIGWAKCTPSGDWSRTGTLSGTSALLKYSRDGLSWVFITNTSSWKGSTFPRQIDALFRNAFKRVTFWPERDLFDF